MLFNLDNTSVNGKAASFSRIHFVPGIRVVCFCFLWLLKNEAKMEVICVYIEVYIENVHLYIFLVTTFKV